jgi:Transposase DDE domain
VGAHDLHEESGPAARRRHRAGVLRGCRRAGPLASSALAEYFTIDGTLLEAWAGQKSFTRKDRPSPPPDDSGNPTINFHGERRSNQTHQSTTDSDSRLFKKAKGHEAKLAYLGEVLMENRHGLVVDACVVPATGTGERDAAISLLAGLPSRRVTVGGDKGYDTHGFIETLRHLQATPHIACKKKSRTLDRRTTRHIGYDISACGSASKKSSGG